MTYWAGPAGPRFRRLSLLTVFSCPTINESYLSETGRPTCYTKSPMVCLWVYIKCTLMSGQCDVIVQQNHISSTRYVYSWVASFTGSSPAFMLKGWGRAQEQEKEPTKDASNGLVNWAGVWSYICLTMLHAQSTAVNIQKNKSPHSGVEITSGFTHSLRGCYWPIG